MKSFLLFLVLFCWCLVGCSKTSTSTTINPDGSWKRSVKLTVTKMSETEDKWPETFTLPNEGYTSVEKVDKQDKIVTLTRDAKLGDGPFTDIIVKSKGETILKNYVVVRRLDDSRIEYYEKIVFPNPKAGKSKKEMEEMASELKKAMPESVGATDEELQAVSQNTLRNLLRLIFGPDDLLVGLLFTNPDGAERRIKARIFKIIDKNMMTTFGDRMTAEQRTETVKRMFKNMDGRSLLEKNTGGTEGQESAESLVGMSTSLSFPGKILESNGEIDPLTGEVYWDYLSNAAELGELELRVICELKK